MMTSNPKALNQMADGGDELFLLEKWKNGDAVAEHGRQPHYAGLKALKAEYVTDTVIERFESAD